MAVSDHLAKAVVKGIRDQMDRCSYHDVVVIVDSTEFKCHRFLLSACSEFFRATFQSGMKEDLNRKVVLKGISCEAFKLIIDSVYYAKGVLSPDNVSSVWHAANLLQISFLLEACEIFQSKRLSKENCVDIRIDSKLLNSKKLIDLSWDVIVKEFNHLRQQDDILFLDVHDLKSLVGDDNLTVPSEDVVVETIIRWVNCRPNKHSEIYRSESFEEDQQDQSEKKEIGQKAHDKTMSSAGSKNTQKNIYKEANESNASVDVDRKVYLFELLAASKLMLVSGACLQNLIENELVLKDPKSFALVRQCLRYHLQPGRRHSYCTSYGIYRNTSSLQNITYAISGVSPMKFSCRTFDGKWYTLPGQQQLKCKAVTYEDDIYWTVSSGTYQLASKYDIISNAWRNIASPNILRQDHALVCLGNYIYAIGGVNCVSIERYNLLDERKIPGTGKWENYGNLVQAMCNLTATTCGDLIVVFGSDASNSPTTTVQIFNTQTLNAEIVMDNMSGSAQNMTTFQNGEDTFVLQRDGAMWKINAINNQQVNIEFHTVLWGDPFELYGAVVTNQELLVFGVGIDPLMAREWDVTGFEHFKRIKIIERQGCCFLNTVIQKRFLVTPET